MKSVRRLAVATLGAAILASFVVYARQEIQEPQDQEQVEQSPPTRTNAPPKTWLVQAFGGPFLGSVLTTISSPRSRPPSDTGPTLAARS